MYRQAIREVTAMVELTEKEKREMCIELAEHLPKIRELLKLSQKAFGDRCGISTPRMSVIENKHFVMTWSQLTSIMFIVFTNQKTKEYFLMNNLLGPKFMQFIQQKEDSSVPDINIVVENIYVDRYKKQFYDKYVKDWM